MNLLQCILKENECYKTGAPLNPIGVMIHSTGADNPWAKRYVQPAKDDPNRAELLEQIGVNKNGNDWNNTTRQVCVHGFIGKLADGSVGSVQTLPWDMRGWHSGRGYNGTANDTHIGIEICEDGLTDPVYFAAVYKEIAELTAMLCRRFNWDPLADGVVICHSEGYKRGIASNHGDVMHWFPKHGKSMDTFRADVAALLVEPIPVPEDAEWDAFNQHMSRYLYEQKAAAPSSWSEAARAWAESNGIVKGTGNGDMEYKRPVTREEMVEMLYRFSQIIKQ